MNRLISVIVILTSLCCIVPRQILGQFNQQIDCPVVSTKMFHSSLDGMFYARNLNSTSLVQIDPGSCSIIDTLAIPDSQEILHMSSDGTIIYLRQLGVLHVYDVAQQEVLYTIDLGVDSDGDNYVAKSLSSFPNKPKSFAVFERSSSSLDDRRVRVFDDTIPRPMAMDGIYMPDRIVAVDSTQVIGVGQNFGDASFFRIPVSADGVGTGVYHYNTDSPIPYSPMTMAYRDSLLYFQNGVVVDPHSTPPVLYGQFELPDVDYSEEILFTFDEYNGVIWWLWNTLDNPSRLGVYNPETLENFQTYDNEYVQGTYALYENNLMSWGEGNLSFLYGVGSNQRWRILSNCLNPIEEPPYSLDTLHICTDTEAYLYVQDGLGDGLWSTGVRAPQIDVSFTFPSDESYYYQYIDSVGCISPAAHTYVQREAFPGYPHFNSDFYEICADEVLDLTVNQNSDYELVWSTGDTIDPLPVTGNASLTVQFLSHNGACLGYHSDMVFITAFEDSLPPVPVLEYDPPLPVCASDILTISLNHEYHSYNWSSIYEPIVELVDGPSLELDFSNGTQLFGTLRLRVSNEVGCTVELNSIPTDYIAYESEPWLSFTSLSYDELCINAGQWGYDSVLWFRNGELVSEGTALCYTPELGGNYHAQGRMGDCYSELTETRQVDLDVTEELTAYYNGSEGTLDLLYNLDPFASYEVLIFDQVGRIVLRTALSSTVGLSQIDFTSAGTGAYFIRLQSSNNTVLSKRFVKF